MENCPILRAKVGVSSSFLHHGIIFTRQEAVREGEKKRKFYSLNVRNSFMLKGVKMTCHLENFCAYKEILLCKTFRNYILIESENKFQISL